MASSQSLACRWPSRLRLAPSQVHRTCLAVAPAARFSSSPRCSRDHRVPGSKLVAKEEAAERQWQAKARRIRNGEEQCLWDIFEERGYVKDIAGSSEGIRELMIKKRIGAYVGVDPTAFSLHVGNLLPLMPLFWMYMHGFEAITLLGGATAKVGDPSGRTTSREPYKTDILTKNALNVHYQLKRIWENVDVQAKRYGYEREWAWKRGIRNNNTWWNKQPLLEFLRMLGSRARVGPMLAKDTVKRRMVEGDGLSFAELSYSLMQGWDWWELYKQRGIQMQIGGSDQYGNITTGRDAVKWVREGWNTSTETLGDGPLDEPVGFTVPLLTDGTGAKIGKSAGGGNLWLDATDTRPYDLYGYFVRQSDENVERMLKLYTFIPMADIRALMEDHEADKPKRVAQHRLALEVLRLVHGTNVAQHCQDQHKMLHGKDEPVVHEHEHTAQVNLQNAPGMRVKLPDSLIFGQSIARILYGAGLSASVSDGHRLTTQRGIYVGSRSDRTALDPGSISWSPVETWLPEKTRSFVIDDKLLLLRKGKHHIRMVEIVNDDEYAASGEMYPGMPYTGRVRLAKKAFESGGRLVGRNLPTSDSKLQALQKSLAFFQDHFDPMVHNPNSHPEKLRAKIKRLEEQQEVLRELNAEKESEEAWEQRDPLPKADQSSPAEKKGDE